MGARRGSAAGWCGLAAVALAAAVPIIAGRRRPGYEHRARYISELGEHGAPDGRAVSLGGFLPIGVLSGAFGWGAVGALKPSPLAAAGVGAVAAGVAVGYSVAAVAPCDPGCPATGGSTRQRVHNAAGVVEYLGGAVGLVTLGLAGRNHDDLRPLARSALALSVPYTLVLARSASAPSPERRGLDQRRLETILFTTIATVSLHLLRDLRKPLKLLDR